MTRPIDFLLGLPALRDGPLWRTACRLNAPLLISANAFSNWRRDPLGLRHWVGFQTRALGLVHTHKVSLDSAGFVAAQRYRGFPWNTEDYLNLAAAAPWAWWAAMDWCVEPEVANDRSAVLDRISGTVRLNIICRNGAETRGIADRFVPVLQGWQAVDYLRCLERMPWALDYPLIGIGSMCRRPVEGEHGIRRVLDTLDRALEGSGARTHLFGLKAQGFAVAKQYPVVASCDSQAYGIEARQAAWKNRRPKTDLVVAAAMARWYQRQHAVLVSSRHHRTGDANEEHDENDHAQTELEERVSAAAEELRSLLEAGEIEWTDLSPNAAFEYAFMDE